MPILVAVISGIFLLINTLISSTKNDSPIAQQEITGDKNTAIIAEKESPVTVTPKKDSPTPHQENEGNKSADNDSPSTHVESQGDQSPAFVAEPGSNVTIDY